MRSIRRIKELGVIFTIFLHFSVFAATQQMGDERQEFLPLSSFSKGKETFDPEKRIYLASYPRSGNHWVRLLVEEATHIVTSSVHLYHNKSRSHFSIPYTFMSDVFPWGGYCVKNGFQGDCKYPSSEECILVKTHFPAYDSEFDGLPYRTAIRLIRHPVDSFYSHYSLHSLQTVMPLEQYLLQKIPLWQKFQEYWDGQPNVLTIRYEDLYQDPRRYLIEILTVMGYKFSQEDIERAVKKSPPMGGLLKHISHYSDEHRSRIYSSLSSLMDKYGYAASGIKGL